MNPDFWISSSEKLVSDPVLVQGFIPNGLRYIFLKNKTSEKSVSLHLDVQTGSCNEAENQRGLAHFMEHMVSNGSKHFKPGKLVEYFQSICMSFGADANAHTGFFETVFDIFLPGGDKKNLEDGFLVLVRRRIIFRKLFEFHNSVVFEIKIKIKGLFTCEAVEFYTPFS